MTIIDEARKMPAVDQLYQSVEKITDIEVIEGAGDYWESSTSNGKTTITTGKSNNPAASLFHELLHAEMKNSGYAQYTYAVTTNAVGKGVTPILEALDNELQHHRFYPKFAAAGFKPNEFYSPKDKGAFRDTRKELQKMGTGTAPQAYFLKLLTVIAPGGFGSEDDRRKLRFFLNARCGATTEGIMYDAEAEIQSWAKSTTLDQGPAINSILKRLGFDGVWVGKSKNFPDDGLFIGQPFDVADAIRV